MTISLWVLGVIILIAAVYVIFEFKRWKHKLFALLLIGLILFGFFSFNLAFKGQTVQLTSIAGVEQASQIYFSWLANSFNNVKIVTTQAIKMNWASNNTT